jgi:hypothetical protein
MSSDLITHLTDLLDRWENLANAASQQVETANQPVPASFYAGVLFGMGVAQDELAATLARAIAETTKPPAGMTARQPLN